MSIFDLLDDNPDPAPHAFMVLEFGIMLDGKPHWRISTWGPHDFPDAETAQAAVLDKHPDLTFVDPPRRLTFGDNLGPVAYGNRWNLVAIYRTDTGEVRSVGWLTPPTA